MAVPTDDLTIAPVDPEKFVAGLRLFVERNWCVSDASDTPGWPAGELPPAELTSPLRYNFRNGGQLYPATARMIALGEVFRHRLALQDFIKFPNGSAVVAGALLRAAAVCRMIRGDAVVFDIGDLRETARKIDQDRKSTGAAKFL